MDLSFNKKERLKSRKTIERLFKEGRSVKKFPIRILFLPVDSATHHQAAFSVPKRNFKSAVQRNRIKRQLKEAYRHHKHLLSEMNGRKFALLVLYISKEPLQYAKMDASMKQLLNQLNHEIS